MSKIPLVGCPSLALLPALVLALALLPGCTTAGTAAAPTTIDTAGDLVEYLNARGHVLRPTGTGAPLVLGRQGQVYEVTDTGARLALYEFASPQEAVRGAEGFPLEAFGGTRAALYRRGALVVVSSGASSSLELTLTQALGPGAY